MYIWQERKKICIVHSLSALNSMFPLPSTGTTVSQDSFHGGGNPNLYSQRVWILLVVFVLKYGQINALFLLYKEYCNITLFQEVNPHVFLYFHIIAEYNLKTLEIFQYPKCVLSGLSLICCYSFTLTFTATFERTQRMSWALGSLKADTWFTLSGWD